VAAQDSERQSISFAMSEPSLRQQAPPSLQRAGSVRGHFIAANDRVKKPTEHDFNDGDRNRDDGRNGSQMVKRQKPFPELKPSYAHYLKRTSFNQEWIREQRAEKVRLFETQRQISPQQNRLSEPSLER
jgi:hypothetical protein